MTRAFLWCGWSALEPVDWCFDEAMDISKQSMRDRMRRMLPDVHFWWMGIECSTMCKAREIPLPWPNAPGPLRSHKHPDGLPHLTGKDLHRVRQDNSNADFLSKLAGAANEQGYGACLENPRNAYLWERHHVAELRETHGFTFTDYAACCCEGARHKRQRLCHSSSVYEIHFQHLISLCTHPL